MAARRRPLATSGWSLGLGRSDRPRRSGRPEDRPLLLSCPFQQRSAVGDRCAAVTGPTGVAVAAPGVVAVRAGLGRRRRRQSVDVCVELLEPVLVSVVELLLPSTDPPAPPAPPPPPAPPAPPAPPFPAVFTCLLLEPIEFELLCPLACVDSGRPSG